MDSRLKLLLGLMAVSVFILVGGLCLCQVYQSDKYVRLAHNNRLRMIRFPAPRGEIFDRNGVPLAVNDRS
ncbi:MAG: penicillin-binding protein 2, partial [Synergistaceae bacterium]|nr:penicillin-binding protein 2 [Synergistaceae bacterium]